MGLDFSHCRASWSYTGFMRFREQVCRQASLGELREYVGLGGEKRWPEDHPLVPFLNHSDCDGQLTPAECGMVAPPLLMAVMSMEDNYDRMMGLRLVSGMLAALADDSHLEFR